MNKNPQWLVALPLALLAAVLADAVLVPAFLNGRPGPQLTAGVVILIGLRRGPFAGLLTGWAAATLRCALSVEPLGLAMLVLGAAGLAAGRLRRLSRLHEPLIDIALTAGLLLLAELLAAALAWIVYESPPHIGIVGIVATALLIALALALWHPEEQGKTSGA